MRRRVSRHITEALFAAGDDDAQLTGTVLFVDGGLKQPRSHVVSTGG